MARNIKAVIRPGGCHRCVISIARSQGLAISGRPPWRRYAAGVLPAGGAGLRPLIFAAQLVRASPLRRPPQCGLPGGPLRGGRLFRRSPAPSGVARLLSHRHRTVSAPAQRNASNRSDGRERTTRDQAGEPVDLATAAAYPQCTHSASAGRVTAPDRSCRAFRHRARIARDRPVTRSPRGHRPTIAPKGSLPKANTLGITRQTWRTEERQGHARPSARCSPVLDAPATIDVERRSPEDRRHAPRRSPGGPAVLAISCTVPPGHARQIPPRKLRHFALYTKGDNMP